MIYVKEFPNELFSTFSIILIEITEFPPSLIKN